METTTAPTLEPLGVKIRRQRRRLGLTLAGLAGRARISKPYLSVIETGRVANPPSDEKLRRLEQTLGFEEGELLMRAHLQRTPADVRAVLQILLYRASKRDASEPVAEPNELEIDHLDRQIGSFDQRIDEVMSPLEHELVEHLDAVPGLNRTVAQVVIAEIGTNMSCYPTARDLASWAGLCPNTQESAGKRRSGRIRHGNGWLKAALVQAAWAAGRTRRSYFSEQHRRIATRRGVKRPNIAVAHSLLVVCYHLIKEGQQYADLGADYFKKPVDPERQAQLLVNRLKKLGYAVTVKRSAA
jgi:transposase